MVVKGAQLSQDVRVPSVVSRRTVISAITQLGVLAVLFKWFCQVAQLRLKLWGVAGGPWPLPFVGTVLRLFSAGLENLHKTALRDVRLFGNLYAWAYFHKPMVNTNCPYHLRRVMVTQWKRYDRSDIEQNSFGELLGQGLILIGNDRWKEMRQLYQSGFSDRNILAFRKVLQSWSHDFVDSLLLAGGHGAQPVDIQEAVQKFTFRAVGFFTLGIDFESKTYMADLEQTMGTSCSNYGELWFQLLAHTQLRVVFGPVRWWTIFKTASVRAFERGHALLLRAIDRAIDARTATPSEKMSSATSGHAAPPTFAVPNHAQHGSHSDEHPGQHHKRARAQSSELVATDDKESFRDLLSCMVGQKGQRFSRTEIRHQALTFLFAGHDTTTNLIAWCLYLLVTHPVELERVQTAVRQGDTQFLRCSLLETLRLYPSAPARSRSLTQADVFCPADPARCPMLRDRCSVELPAGTGVSFAINAVHRDPEHWPDPEIFKPSRFEDHVAKAPSALLTAPWVTDEGPLKYLPFGAGPRRCIGERLALLEAEEICCAVLKRCKVQIAPGPPPVDEMQLTMRAKNGIHLLFDIDEDCAR
mmetsp:Transcript_71058/g.117673  ORF Transcript_71058/g.117673 Transcript_71058/m.117673 type:complete len:585 (+) Transcript_71058:61-1815(+)